MEFHIKKENECEEHTDDEVRKSFEAAVYSIRLIFLFLKK